MIMFKSDNTVELATARRNIRRAYTIVFAIGIPYLIFVLATGLRFPCLLYELTHIQCPGCGITRMFMSIALLRFSEAFNYNPLAFILVPIINLAAIFAYIGKPKFIRNRYFLSISSSVAAIITVLFGILRNFY